VEEATGPRAAQEISIMATITLSDIGNAPARAGGPFRRVLARMMNAREMQARRYVNDYLRSLDDATLATYGVDRKTLMNGINAHAPW
jgi:hypothetical protein